TRPALGMRPAIPQYEAGPRIEPPVSEPIAHGARPAATAAPDPLDEPPVKCSRFHGLRAGGQGRSKDGPPCANSCVAVLPSRIAPASYNRRVTVASAVGMRSMHTRECPDVRMPAVSKMSFNANGTPCNGPRYFRRPISRSACCACARARSAVTVMNAFSCGSSASIRRRDASVSSTGDRLRLLSACDASPSVRKHRFSDMTASFRRADGIAAETYRTLDADAAPAAWSPRWRAAFTGLVRTRVEW